MPTTYLINSSFFNGTEISIPNSAKADVAELLANLIHKYEPDCLLKILGYPLYKIVKAQIDGGAIEQRITDLLEGVEWTLPNGELSKWQGIVHDTNISLIANYIYWYFKHNEATQSSGIGTVIPKGNSVVQISPKDKMTSAWNFFSSEVADMIYFLRNRVDNTGANVYPEFSDRQYLIAGNISRPISVFDF